MQLCSMAVWGLIASLAVSVGQAHVTVRPAKSNAGAQETYTVRVPTEGKSTTTSLELEIPEGVSIVSVAGPSHSYKLKQEGGRVVSITWAVTIEPQSTGELIFVARNPAAVQELAWKAHQHFADGTSAHWVGAPGTQRPASVTQLVQAK